MKTFKQYLKESSIPKVQFGIHSGELTEGINDHAFPEMLSPTPISHGYVYTNSGIYTHPDHPGKFFFHHSDGTIKSFDKESDADNYSIDVRHEYRSKVDVVHTSLDDLFHRMKYPEREESALSHYSGISNSVNSQLISGVGLSEPNRTLVGHLDNAMTRVHVPHDITVYTGTNSEHAKLIRENDVLHHPAYVSASLDYNIARRFADDKGGDLIKLHVPAGLPGVYIGSKSLIPREREFMLPRNLNFVIDHSKRSYLQIPAWAHNREKPTMVHHATIV